MGMQTRVVVLKIACLKRTGIAGFALRFSRSQSSLLASLVSIASAGVASRQPSLFIGDAPRAAKKFQRTVA
eukprot:5907517-Amphidinium_carterae.1